MPHSVSERLLDAFLGAAGPAAAAADRSALARAVDRTVAAARAAWPGVVVPAPRFAATLGARVAELAGAGEPPEPLDEALGAAAAGGDPELAYARARQRDHFTGAFREALATLATDERNLLRLYFLEGLTVEQIAAMRGSAKSSVSRWLSRARRTLLELTRAVLRERSRLSESEIQSVLAAAQSRL